jgi:hypothetical protein
LDIGEQCDDGRNGDPCDGCLDTCQTHQNYCGDGFVCGSEACDDGVNDGNYDSCGSDCGAGPPDQLVFVQQPSNTVAGIEMAPAIEVAVQDQSGRPVRGASMDVRLSLAIDPTGGEASLTGGGPVAAYDGVALFPAVVVDLVASGYALDAEAPSLIAARSRAFGIGSTDVWSPHLDQWQWRKRLTIPARSPRASLANFPLLVHLRNDGDLRARARSDGFDIRFTTIDGTLVAHDLESYDGSSGTLVAWVQVPVLDTATDTELFMYYGKASASGEPAGHDVWSDGYVAVWHLGERANGTAGEFDDATGNGNGGTGGAGSGAATPTAQTGVIGQGQSGDGVNDFIATPVSMNGRTRSSISFWAYVRRVNNMSAPGLVGQNDSVEMGFYWRDRLNVWSPGMTVNCPGKTIQSLCTANFPLNEWFHLAVTSDGSNLVMYLNGQRAHSVPAATGRSSSYRLSLLGRVFSASGNHLDGVLDEVRLADRPRPEAWFTLEYDNQRDPGSFVTVGAEEALP